MSFNLIGNKIIVALTSIKQFFFNYFYPGLKIKLLCTFLTVVVNVVQSLSTTLGQNPFEAVSIKT